MRKRWSGFSLVELIIALAVLSILGSIAIPGYMRYVASAKANAGRAELSALQISFDSAIVAGRATPSLSDIGLPATSSLCTTSLTSTEDGGAVLACALINPPYLINGGTISLIRSGATGAWTCQVNAAIGTTYAPNGCTVGG